MSVFRVDYLYSIEELNQEWCNFSEDDKDIIMNLDIESFFDYEDEDMYICYMIVDESDLDTYLKTLDKYEVYYNRKDISNIILQGNIDLEHELLNHICYENHIKYEFFMDDINNWILDNLEIDDVLDRISNLGIHNLSSVEKEFLRAYSESI